MRRYRDLQILVIFLFACMCAASWSEAADLKSRILGKWVEEGGTERIELFNDGTVIVVKEGKSATGDYRFIDNNRMRVDMKDLLGSTSSVFEVSINAKTGELSFKEPAGKVSVYVTEAEFARRSDAARKSAAKAEQKRNQSAFASIKKNMLFIKGDCFDMGDTFGDGFGHERPVHLVCVDDFIIGKYEVTQKEWRDVMGSNPAYFNTCDNCPIEQVSWDDIQNFINRINHKTGQKYRLPTEAEWEYAARSGGKNEKWAGTSNSNEIGDYSWFHSNSDSRTHPVGLKKPNNLGLFDMNGNVSELVQDLYDRDYYEQRYRDNPAGPSSGLGQVTRGGHWLDDAHLIRATYRNNYFRGFRFNYLGLRLAASPTEAERKSAAIALVNAENDPDMLERLADKYYVENQFNEAVAAYKKLLKVRRSTDIYIKIGLSLHFIGNTAEGIKYLEDGILQDQSNQRIWLHKGYLLVFGMKDVDGACAAWGKTMALDPENEEGKAASEDFAKFNCAVQPKQK